MTVRSGKFIGIKDYVGGRGWDWPRNIWKKKRKKLRLSQKRERTKDKLDRIQKEWGDPSNAFPTLTTCRQHAPPPGDFQFATSINEKKKEKENKKPTWRHSFSRPNVISGPPPSLLSFSLLIITKETGANPSQTIIIFSGFQEKGGCARQVHQLLFSFPSVAVSLYTCANFWEILIFRKFINIFASKKMSILV